jgi:hypothetical protein
VTRARCDASAAFLDRLLALRGRASPAANGNDLLRLAISARAVRGIRRLLGEPAVVEALSCGGRVGENERAWLKRVSVLDPGLWHSVGEARDAMSFVLPLVPRVDAAYALSRHVARLFGVGAGRSAGKQARAAGVAPATLHAIFAIPAVAAIPRSLFPFLAAMDADDVEFARGVGLEETLAAAGVPPWEWPRVALRGAAWAGASRVTRVLLEERG